MVHFGAEKRPKAILILERTREICSFATIQDLLAYLRASQINFEVSTWTSITQFGTTFDLIRFVPSHMGLPGFYGRFLEVRKAKSAKKSGGLLGRIEDSILLGPGQTQGSGQKWGP